jgi:hypothetical protein
MSYFTSKKKGIDNPGQINFKNFLFKNILKYFFFYFLKFIFNIKTIKKFNLKLKKINFVFLKA